MAHNHGSEYQVRIVRGDGTEELTVWLPFLNQKGDSGLKVLARGIDHFFWQALSR